MRRPVRGPQIPSARFAVNEFRRITRRALEIGVVVVSVVVVAVVIDERVVQKEILVWSVRNAVCASKNRFTVHVFVHIMMLRLNFEMAKRSRPNRSFLLASKEATFFGRQDRNLGDAFLVHRVNFRVLGRHRQSFQRPRVSVI